MKLRNTRHRSRRAAFTLMEMMVVVAIIVALAGAGIFYMAGQIDEGAKTKAQAGVKALDTACGVYKAQHQGNWPADLTVLRVKDADGYGPYVLQDEDLMDPWGGRYQYDIGGGRNQGVRPDIFVQNPNFGTFGNWSSKWHK